MRGLIHLAGSHDLRAIWDLGFGAVSETAVVVCLPDFIKNSSRQLVWMVFLANLPQLLFSLLYFQYNALFTGMLAAKEWSDFGWKRRGVRVPWNPKGEQRSRYFLQLPYRWGIPLLIASILIHWLLSQSIFLIAAGTPGDYLYVRCGFSLAPMIFIIGASIIMAIALGITGFRRLSTAMPVVGSCSLAIAAACHYSDGIPRSQEPLARLKWGVTKGQNEDGDGTPGHCGFSSNYVENPEAGVEYA